MVKMLALVFGLIVVGGASVGALFVVGMRTKWAPVIDFVRRRNREKLNPEQLKTAGEPGAFAGVLRHTGRVSGKAYETPLGIKPYGDDFVIAIVYGPRTEWLQNVLASGKATIVYEGSTYTVARPEVVSTGDVADAFPWMDRFYNAVLAVDSCLRLHRADASLG